MTPRDSRSGAALVLALLVVLGAALVTTALLHVSSRELVVAGSAGAVLRARAAAESTVRRAAAGWPYDGVLDMEPGATLAVILPDLPGNASTDRVIVQRLGGDLFLVRASAAVAGATARAGMLVAVLDPAEIWRGFAATLAAAGNVHLGPEAQVSGTDSGVPVGWDADLCAPAAAIARQAFGEAPRPGLVVANEDAVLLLPGAELTGDPDLLIDPSWMDRYAGGLGRLGFVRVAAVADREESGELRLGPAYRLGGCDAAAAGNWGDPLAPASPCGEYVPLVFSPGDLRVLGGYGQGVIVADGDLRIDRGTRFFGLIVALGNLAVEPGAEVHGALLALGEGPHDVGGTILRSDCVVFRTLGRAGGLNRAFSAGSRQWIPLF